MEMAAGVATCVCVCGLVCCFRAYSAHTCSQPSNHHKRRQLCSQVAILFCGSVGIFRLVLLCRSCIVCCNDHPCILQAVSSWPACARPRSALCGSAATIGLQHQCMVHSRKRGGKASSAHSCVLCCTSTGGSAFSVCKVSGRVHGSAACVCLLPVASDHRRGVAYGAQAKVFVCCLVSCACSLT